MARTTGPNAVDCDGVSDFRSRSDFCEHRETRTPVVRKLAGGKVVLLDMSLDCASGESPVLRLNVQCNASGWANWKRNGSLDVRWKACRSFSFFARDGALSNGSLLGAVFCLYQDQAACNAAALREYSFELAGSIGSLRVLDLVRASRNAHTCREEAGWWKGNVLLDLFAGS